MATTHYTDRTFSADVNWHVLDRLSVSLVSISFIQELVAFHCIFYGFVNRCRWNCFPFDTKLGLDSFFINCREIVTSIQYFVNNTRSGKYLLHILDATSSAGVATDGRQSTNV